MVDEQKQAKNLFKKLVNDQNSVFYSSDKITKTLLNKGRKSSYEKDKAFYRIFNLIEDKDVIYDFDTDKPKLPFYTPFIEQKKILIDLLRYILLTVRCNFFMQMLLIYNFFQKVLSIRNML